ncbi:MAG TPA: Stp1/IreP family PP2C-type Ser/Thr phosphatase [Gammaproteobacteria bacterium]|nr:Stp1/IreP family PP2C-type Ser/Thr phosphatase [Gammaproteobacteria bacterium]
MNTTIAYTVAMAGITDTGRAREHNEDAIAWDESRGLALLADGMGGHNAGDVASRLCIDTLNEILLPTLDKPLRLRPNKHMSRHATLARRAVNKANTAIYENAEANPARKGMGTTLAMVLFYDDKAVVAHVGDSRVYRLRGRELEQITADHSLVRELLEKGVISAEEAEDNPYSHVITKAVGVRPRVVAEVQEFATQPGDVFLLCSDGLTDLVDERDIAEALGAFAGHWQRAAQHLVDLANNHGGRDNISVVIAALGGPR